MKSVALTSEIDIADGCAYEFRIPQLYVQYFSYIIA